MEQIDYIEDEFPLPSFTEVFGDILNSKTRKRKSNKIDKLINEESTGRWTAEEHRLFLEGIMQYGRDWKKIQPLIKTRSLVQIRTHAQKVFQRFGVKLQKLDILESHDQFGDDGDCDGEDDYGLDDGVYEGQGSGTSSLPIPGSTTSNNIAP